MLSHREFCFEVETRAPAKLIHEGTNLSDGVPLRALLVDRSKEVCFQLAQPLGVQAGKETHSVLTLSAAERILRR